MKINQLFTKEKSDLGVKIQIMFFKGKKKPTLTIYGCDGEFFKNELKQNRLNSARVLALPLQEQEAARRESDLILVANCIKEWSFDEECNLENKIELLRNSPGVFELVNHAVFDRSLFLG